MKAEFATGAEERMTVTTTPDMGITHLGPDVPSMYSTPSMIGLIEGTCVKLMSRYVDPGEQSVVGIICLARHGNTCDIRPDKLKVKRTAADTVPAGGNEFDYPAGDKSGQQ